MELHAQKVGRGNIAQIKAQGVQAERRVDQFHSQIDLIMKKLDLDIPPAPVTGMIRRDEPGNPMDTLRYPFLLYSDTLR